MRSSKKTRFRMHKNYSVVILPGPDPQPGLRPVQPHHPGRLRQRPLLLPVPEAASVVNGSDTD